MSAMTIDTNPIIEAVKAAVALFKAGDYEKLQKFVVNQKIKDVIQAETDPKLKDAANNLFEHMSIATTTQVSERLNNELLKVITPAIDLIEKKTIYGGLNHGHINTLANRFADSVHKISDAMQQQDDALTVHEKELFNKGNYWWELTKSRWSGSHHDGAEAIIQVNAPIAPPPQSLSNMGGILGGLIEATENAMPQPITIPKTITLEGKALEEFGKVTLLDDAWKKAGAITAGLAGVGIAAHGVRNVYLSINPEASEKLEVAELGHTKTKDGEINWLRMMAGAAEIGVGGAIIVRQATGRQFWELNKPVVGSFTALCDHGDAAAIGKGV